MSASDSTYGAAVPRRAGTAARTRVAYINVWLLAILLLGAVIVLIDGATRAPLNDNISYWGEALVYEPYVGAYIFAALSLPLVFVWARRLRASKKEALLLWFLLGTTAYTRDFAYVKVPGVPLYVTDVVLVLLVLSVFVWPRLRLLPLRSPYTLFCLLFAAIGAEAAVRGFASGQEGTRVLRDFAMVLYPAFLLVAYYLCRSWESLLRAAHIIMLGSALLALSGIAWFIAQPGQRRYIAYGMSLTAAFVVMIVVWARRAMAPAVMWALTFLLGLGVILSMMRSLYLALAAALVVFFWFSRATGSAARLSVKRLLALVAVGVLALVVVDQTSAGGVYLARTSSELASGLLHTQDDDNAQFRLLAWGEATFRFTQNPLFGEGFGVPFSFALGEADADPRPHNTYLTVLYKMGIVAELPLLALLGYFLVQTGKALRRHQDHPHAGILLALLLAQVVMAVFGFVNLLLESPFLASLFWINLGLTLRATRLLDEANALSHANGGAQSLGLAQTSVA